MLKTTLIDRYSGWLFWAALIALLLPVWLNRYFLTGDGPCHVYNARVLLDWWLGRNQPFYAEYYELNRLIVPNQFVHGVLALLQLGLPGVVAEKVLLSLYVVGFATGMRYLLRTIRPGAEFLVYPALPFIMSRPMLMGFLNYSFSIVGCLWLAAFWLRRREASRLSTAAWLSIGLLLEYLMHPVGLSLTLLVLAACSVGGLVAGRTSTWRAAIRQLGQEALLLGLASLPALVLLGVYMFQVNGLTTPSPLTTLQRWHAFCRQDALAALSDREVVWMRSMAPGLGLLLLVGLRLRGRSFRLQSADVFLALSLLMLYAYFQAPEGGAGGSILVMRLESIPLLLLLPWLALVPWPGWSRLLIGGLGLLVSGAVLVVRWPIQRQVSMAETDYLSVVAHIAPNSTVLPLSFNHSGQVPGVDLIPARVWLFMHAADYLGTMRAPVIMLGNYEANTGTFPFRWIWERNPFAFLSASTSEGLESQPPSVNIDNYRQHGGKVDYVLLWCARDHFANHSYTQELRAVLARDYRRVATSPLGYAELFERRNRRPWNAW